MHIPSHPLHTTAHCNPLQPAANHPMHIQCTHCSSHYIFSTHCSQSSVHTAAILSSAHCSYTIQCTLQLFYPVHTAAILSSAHCSHVQLSAANLQCTLQPTAAIYNHLHCSYTIQCTLQLYYPVHTAAILSSAHCSYTIQCTLQLYYPVHTTAILSSAHCSYTIQCTLQLHYLVPIPYSASSAPLDHHRVSLYHYWPTSRAVSKH